MRFAYKVAANIPQQLAQTREVDFMRALLCGFVGADRADQVAHKSYVWTSVGMARVAEEGDV